MFSGPATSLGGLKDHKGLHPDGPLISRREPDGGCGTQQVSWWSVSIHHQCRGGAGPASPQGASGPLADSKARMALQGEKGATGRGPVSAQPLATVTAQSTTPMLADRPGLASRGLAGQSWPANSPLFVRAACQAAARTVPPFNLQTRVPR